jgi:AraC-like DNA-binding protein
MLSHLKTSVEEYIEECGGGEGLFLTPIDGLALMKTSKEVLPHHMVYKPALCVVAQGAKQLILGDQVWDYGEGTALVVSVELPAFGKVTRVTRSEPYLGLSLEFDVALMREVMDQLDVPPIPGSKRSIGLFLQVMTASLADCITRLVRLLSMPEAIPILYPLIMREICFWLLTGPNAGEVCKIALPNGNTRRIADAIHMLRENYLRPIRIAELAVTARMSPTSFHQHFKTLTSITPLQYQKQLRLLEAQRLIVADSLNVAQAALQVGYESASQFSREYARMFGKPPKRDSMTKRPLRWSV